MNKIDLMNYVDDNWRVVLDNNFRQKLKRKVKERKLKIKTISHLTGKSIDSIWKLQEGRFNPTFGYLKILCKKLNVGEKELYQNIDTIYAGVKKASFTVRSITVDEEFAAWWGAWIGEGNHTATHESISMTNYEVNLLELHINMLRKFKFPINKSLVEVITNQRGDKDIIRQRWSRILNLPKSQITSITYMERATQEGARVQVWSAGLFRILHTIDDEVKGIISKSSLEVKIAYLRGIYAAEGSVRRMEVRINMNDHKEIKFVKETLFAIGIQTSSIRLNNCNDCYELSVLGYDNIRKFKEIDGFQLHVKRKRKLHEIFSHYENKLPDHIRFERLKNLLAERNEITKRELASIFDITYANAHRITSKFSREGKLTVDRSEKELKYSLPT